MALAVTVLTWLICLTVAVPAAGLALECLVGVLPRSRAKDGQDAPPFVVLMPAHDEAAGIGNAIRPVLAQLRACDRLLVVADNCTDDTAAVAQALGAHVIIRNDTTKRGKSHALDFGRDHLANRPDWHEHPDAVVVIVDADCSPAEGALQRLVATSAAQDAAVQGAYLLVPPAGANAIQRLSCFAFLVKNLTRQIGLRRLSGAALLQGSGMAFPAAVFRKIDWSPDSLVEDLDIGLRLVMDGKRVTFEERARFVSDASSQGATVGQRRRWEHGMLEAMRTFVPKLLGSALAGRPRFLFLAIDQTIPPTVLLLMVAGLASVIAASLAFFLGGPWLPVIILLTSSFAMGIGVFAAWAAHGRSMLAGRDIVSGLGYIVWKLPILAQFVTRRQKQWVRTERAP